MSGPSRNAWQNSSSDTLCEHCERECCAVEFEAVLDRASGGSLSLTTGFRSRASSLGNTVAFIQMRSSCCLCSELSISGGRTYPGLEFSNFGNSWAGPTPECGRLFEIWHLTGRSLTLVFLSLLRSPMDGIKERKSATFMSWLCTTKEESGPPPGWRFHGHSPNTLVFTRNRLSGASRAGRSPTKSVMALSQYVFVMSPHKTCFGEHHPHML